MQEEGQRIDQVKVAIGSTALSGLDTFKPPALPVVMLLTVIRSKGFLMYIPRQELLKKINAGDKVLDVGSWNDVFPRANVIIDLNSYETRKNHQPDQEEHFSKETWYVADVNRLETWEMFGDKEFDFVICSHLLEDVRDPLFVCQQLNRVAKRGYIEVPVRYRECSRALAGDTVSGYDHHRWLVDIIDDSLVFTAKLHWAHTVDYLTEEKRDYLNFHNFHYFGCFFDAPFHYYERCPKGEILEGANLIYQFEKLDLAQLHEQTFLARVSGNRHPGNMLWVDQFSLPLETESKDVIQRYKDTYRKSHVGYSLAELEGQITNLNQSITEKDTRLADLMQVLAEREGQITTLNQSVIDRDAQLADLTQDVAKCQAEIAGLKGICDAMLESHSWRVTVPLRAAKRFMARWV